MDGVERIMVLGIFAVIVAILSIAAWGVTDDGEGSVFDGGDGGLVLSDPSIVTSDDKSALAHDGQRATGNDARGADEGGASKAGEQSPVGRNPNDTRPPRIVDNRGMGGGRIDRNGTPRPPVDPGVIPLKPKGVPINRPQGTAGTAGGATRAPTTVQHKVVKGDTVWSIVRDHFGTGDIKGQLKIVAQLNPAIDLDDITEGDILELPTEVPEEVVSKPITQQTPAGTRLYTIGAGETLTHIANEQLGDGKRANELYELNRKTIAHPDKVFEGMTILLPVR